MSKLERDKTNLETINYLLENEGEPWLLLFDSYVLFESENTWFDKYKKMQTKLCEDIMEGNAESLSIKNKTLNFYYKLENNKVLTMHCIRDGGKFYFVSCNFNSTASKIYHLWGDNIRSTKHDKLREMILENIEEVDDPVYRYIKNRTLNQKDLNLIKKYINSYKKIDNKLEEELPFLSELKLKFYNPENIFTRRIFEYIYVTVTSQKELDKENN